MQGLRDPDPNFCKVLLTENALVFLNDDFSKQDELLLKIPISQIEDFIFINEKKQKKDNFISFFWTLIGGLFFTLGGHGFYANKENNADILSLSFINEQGEKLDFILNMMEHGENGIIKEYKKLINR